MKEISGPQGKYHGEVEDHAHIRSLSWMRLEEALFFGSSSLALYFCTFSFSSLGEVVDAGPLPDHLGE